jgi:hypothetical protein
MTWRTPFRKIVSWGACLACAVIPGIQAGAAVEEVVVVFKTHFDIGYTDLARNVVAKYRTTMIDNALAVCDDAKSMPPEHRFVWTLSGWPMAQVLWPGQTPERRGRIEEAIRDGRLVWHALPATLHTESLDLEDLVRGLGFSSRLSRRFGMPLPRDAKMTEVPALGPNPDGGGNLLRLWEQAGAGGVCGVRLPGPLRRTALQPCDLRGQPQGEPILPHEGRHEIPLSPFAPASFLLDAP